MDNTLQPIPKENSIEMSILRNNIIHKDNLFNVYDFRKTGLQYCKHEPSPRNFDKSEIFVSFQTFQEIRKSIS